MNKILIIDDELAIRRLVAAVLAADGMEGVLAATAAEARQRLREPQGADAVILDLGLPDCDGLELLAEMRACGMTLPIIVLSARESAEDKIAALDLGADDYVTKPFDAGELRARLRSVSRRAGNGAATTNRQFGPLRIDQDDHQAFLHEQRVSLTPREFALLTYLVEAGGKVLTHRQILTKVWGPDHVDDIEYLRVAIRALRKKIEADPARPTLIRNEPGIGYRLVEP